MTAVRADVAAMLRAGATNRQIQEQLHVTEHTLRQARKLLGMVQAKRTRAELTALEDQAVTMLRAGATLNTIHAELRLHRNRIIELRRIHGIPVPEYQHISDKRRLTVDEAFALHTEPTPAGEHLLWTGPYSGRSIQLSASGRRYNPRVIAFRKHHGREPDGRLKRTCDQPLCIAGAHHTDPRLRQAHTHADQAFERIFVTGA
ncbi:helix-turn-helix domain-containing protein [Streptomyces chartreusis]|uniref:hypothetical protein n=1 Tax=Streptomyces chartreusis TaxID=1969 RepID=UPI00382D94C3